MHRFGQEARQAVETGRRQVAGLVGCDVRELVFMSGGTEADNAAILGVLGALTPRRVVVTSTVEHSAVRELLGWLKKSQGVEVVEIGVDVLGRLDMGRLGEVVEKRAGEIALVTIMWANNETGVVFDVAGIGAMCRKYGVVFHVDGVQAVGKVGMVLRELPVDLMSVCGHKFHGPKGVGGLYVRRGVRWQPMVRGGPQERDRARGDGECGGYCGDGDCGGDGGGGAGGWGDGARGEVARFVGGGDFAAGAGEFCEWGYDAARFEYDEYWVCGVGGGGDFVVVE